MNRNLIILALLICLNHFSLQAQTVIYSEDFHNGIPATWSNSGWNNFGNNAQIKWKYTHSGSHGGFSDPSDFINSPSVSNGFIIFDSDSLDNGGTTNTGTGPGTAFQIVDLTTSAINISGHLKIKLQFNEYYKNSNSITSVGFSTDNINWHYDTINNDIGPSGSTTKTKKISIDMTDYVNGQSQVYIRFHMYADYYWWMIDDVTISDLPDNDLSIIADYTIPGSFQLYPTTFFTSCPVSLLGFDSLFTQVYYQNFGKATQYNTTLNVGLIKNGQLLYATSLPPDTISRGQVKSPFTNGVMPQGIGSYKIAIGLSSDSADVNMADNNDTIPFYVTDSVYSINTSNLNSKNPIRLLYSTPSYSASYRTGPYFTLDGWDTVTSITTAVVGGPHGTKPGSVIKATIYQMSNSPYNLGQKVVSTYSKTLTAADITSDTATHVTPVTMLVDYNSGNAIMGGYYYWVGIEGVSSTDTNILLASTKYPLACIPLTEDTSYYATQSFIQTSAWAPYCNINFGRPGRTLYADFNRYPYDPVGLNTSVSLYATSNASAAATYRWDITGLTTGFHQTLVGNSLRDTFQVVDTFNICLTVRDGSDSFMICHGLRTLLCNADFFIYRDTTPHHYIVYNRALGNNLKYIWSFGDGDTSYLPFPTHTYAASGYYTVCLTVVDTVTQCIATLCDPARYFFKTDAAITLTVLNGLTGIGDISTSGTVSIYPNPTNDAFNIKVDGALIGTNYILTDLTGREIASGNLKHETTTVPVGALSPGVYIIHLGTETFKVIKE